MTSLKKTWRGRRWPRLRFRQSPDPRAWTFYIWSRHPRRSLTWTHIFALSWRARYASIGGHTRVYGVRLGNLALQMVRQNATPRKGEGAA